MKIKLFFLLLIIICVACKSESLDIPILDQKISNNEKLRFLLQTDQLKILGVEDAGIDFLQTFYEKRNYNPIWVEGSRLSEDGSHLRELLKNQLAFGLPQVRYELNIKSKHALFSEIRLTHSLALMHEDLLLGLLANSDTILRKVTYPTFKQFKKDLQFAHDKESISRQIIHWGPNDTNYRYMAYELFQFASSHNLSNTNYHVPIEKKDSLLAHQLAYKSLKDKGYLFSDSIKGEDYLLKLRQFQLDNGLEDDGVIGKWTAEALNESNTKKCQRVALSLEKLRKTHLLYDRLIEVNIPEFKLRFYADDSLKSIHRVIVGKLDKQTPEFNSMMRKIVVYPTWSVPFSIRSEEILPAAKNNFNYFERNDMLLYQKEKLIDPKLVNWKKIKDKTFPYRVVQQPGPGNSLGILKFEFQNPFGVYIHDTPNKRLFKTVIRAYSHGCIRCESPIELAKIILLKDENLWINDSLDTLIMRAENFKIKLRKPIPISIVYRTVTLNEYRKIIFLRDIYDRDRKYLSIIF